ncbi:MAG TPA: hypothetical protein VHO06_02085 [Polyangia bacterium]|nr:hypothetical protein [Polyangia bacterium]
MNAIELVTKHRAILEADRPPTDEEIAEIRRAFETTAELAPGVLRAFDLDLLHALEHAVGRQSSDRSRAFIAAEEDLLREFGEVHNPGWGHANVNLTIPEVREKFEAFKTERRAARKEVSR